MCCFTMQLIYYDFYKNSYPNTLETYPLIMSSNLTQKNVK